MDMSDETFDFDDCLTEFPAVLEELDSKLQFREPEFFWPKEEAVVDVTRTIAFIEGEGLYAFWSAHLNQKRIIRSFKKIGATEVANLLIESRWAKNLIKNGDYDSRKQEFGTKRFAEFCRIESYLSAAFKNTPLLILRFAHEKRVTGAPLNRLGRMLAAVTVPLRLLFD